MKKKKRKKRRAHAHTWYTDEEVIVLVLVLVVVTTFSPLSFTTTAERSAYTFEHLMVDSKASLNVILFFSHLATTQNAASVSAKDKPSLVLILTLLFML